MSEKEEEQTCALTYDICIEERPIKRAEVEAQERGACDSILMVSVLHLDEQEDMLDGATSSMMVGLNGRANRPLNPLEIFQIWTGIAHKLSQELPPGTPSRELCEDVNTAVKDMLDGELFIPPGEMN